MEFLRVALLLKLAGHEVWSHSLAMMLYTVAHPSLNRAKQRR